MQKLTIAAVAGCKEVSESLQNQLQQIEYCDCQGIFMDLSVAARHVRALDPEPDAIIVDMTAQEVHAGLFIEKVRKEFPTCEVIALHQEMSHQVMEQAVKYGAREFISYPRDAHALNATLSKVHAVKAYSSSMERKRGRMISVFAAKGGAGATTVSVNLSAELARASGGRVALVDFNQWYNTLGFLLKLEIPYDLVALAQNEPDNVDDDLLEKVMVSCSSGMDVMVLSKNPLENNCPIPERLIQQTMDFLKRQYDFVVLDLPSQIVDAGHQFAIENSEDVLLVTTVDIPALARTRQYISLAQEHMFDQRLQLVLNRSNLSGALGIPNKKIEDAFGIEADIRLSDDWHSNVEANSIGCCLNESNSKSPLSREYRNLAARMCGKKPDKKDSDGMLKKLSGINMMIKGGLRNGVISEARLGI